MPVSTDVAKEIVFQLRRVKAAARRLAQLPEAASKDIILALADLTEANIEPLLAANELDLARMDPQNPKYDRLLLTADRLRSIAADLRRVAQLPSPLGQQLEATTLPNGLHLERLSVPLGVIGIVFESRPNVTFDVFALCLRAGNATVLKGSRDASASNAAIWQLIRQALDRYELADACYLAPAQRDALPVVLQAVGLVDLIIPRGSQGLIDLVRRESLVPVIETGAGIVHTYYDVAADLDKGKAVITNAKARRVSVCNALDCLLVHEQRLSDLPVLLAELGARHQCGVYADASAHAALAGHYPADLLHAATADSYGTEFLSMQLAIRTVPDLDTALAHIAEHSSQHSEAILTEDAATARRFLQEVDAAVVYHNVSTAFTDGGEFGLGAEIGISTQKLHARGPMGLQALTSYKWVVRGAGQVR